MASSAAAIGDRIRRRRQALGLTQEQLCTVAQINFETVVRLEQGAHRPSHRTAAHIARAMAIDVRELLEGEAANDGVSAT